MYGQAETFIAGRITADVVLRKTDAGRAYCYFTVAVNNRPITNRDTGEKVEVPADYYDMSANGPAAEIIANHAKKGTVFFGWTTPKRQKPREVEKDGKTYVYRDVIFRVSAGRFDLLESTVPAKGEGAAESTPTATGASYVASAPPVTSPESDFEDDDAGESEDDGIDKSLPF